MAIFFGWTLNAPSPRGFLANKFSPFDILTKHSAFGVFYKFLPKHPFKTDAVLDSLTRSVAIFCSGSCLLLFKDFFMTFHTQTQTKPRQSPDQAQTKPRYRVG
jgi:hypothetical protein